MLTEALFCLGRELLKEVSPYKSHELSEIIIKLLWGLLGSPVQAPGYVPQVVVGNDSRQKETANGCVSSWSFVSFYLF